MKGITRYVKKAAPSFLLACAMVCTCIPVSSMRILATDNQTTPDLKINFDEPVSEGTLIPGRSGGFNTTEENDRWQQLSLPIGNSRMGANVYGEIGKEHLTFNQKTLWIGGPSDSRKDYNGGNVTTVDGMPMADYVKKVQDMFLNGDPDAANACGKIVGSHDGYGSYQAFGDIYLDFGLNGTPSDYERALDLNDALATVDFTLNGTDYHREYLASYPDDVIAMKVSAKGNDKLNFHVSFPVKNETSENLQKDVVTTVKDNTIVVQGKMKDNQLKLNGQLAVTTQDGSIEAADDQLYVKNASEATIFVSASTDYKNDYPAYRTGESDDQLNQRVKNVIDAAVKKGYAQVKQTGIEDYQNIFQRVHLDLGQTMPDLTTDELLTAYNNGNADAGNRRYIETLLFQYGRYLQISSSRGDDLPANLQGVWNDRVGNENEVPWGSDYHMNVNLQMNYWPTYVTNMAECGIPLIKYVDSLREPGRVTAETYFGVKSDAEHPENGFSAHTQNTPFGWTCPGWAFSWGWSPAAVPWILQNCYEYYEYTQDKEFLRNEIYPMLKEEATLYKQILREDPETGRLVTVPAYSPEQGPYTAGNTYEQSLIWQLYKDSIEAAEALDVDQDLVKEWKDIQSKLNPIEIGDSGQIKEWYSETTLGSVPNTDLHHRHMSHLLGLFPGDLINVDNEKYLDAAIVSLTSRGDDATGWGMGQRLNSWARVGDGNHAYEIIKAFFKAGAYPNLWDAHPPFQIDGNFGYTSGVAEMLIQSNMGYINLLPALADEWQDGHVDGLVARGNFEVSMDWKSSNLHSASILSKSGNECIIAYPNIDQAVVKHNGDIVKTTQKDGKISFQTVANETYTIENIPDRPLKAVENVKAYTDGNKILIDFDEMPFATRYDIYQKDENEQYKKIGETAHAPYQMDGNSGFYKVAAVDTDGRSGTLSKEIKPEDIHHIVKMDDRDSMINYSSGWGDWTDGGQYMSTEKYTDQDGSSLDFYFSGNGLKVIGMKAGNTHTFDLYIDGKKVGENIDTNSTETLRQQVFYEVKNLPEGIHHAQLVVTKAKISLDAFEIIRQGNPTNMSIISDDQIDLSKQTSIPLSVMTTPSGTSAGDITWSVENDLKLPSNIATIDEKGVLTCTHPGTIIVKAEDKEHHLYAQKTIEIVMPQNCVKVDDRDQSITYSDGWTTWDEGKHEFGTISETIQKGSSFSFEFTGNKLALYFMKLEASGGYAGANIDVIIDGVNQGTFSTFTKVSGSEPKSKVFESKPLSNEKHKVDVVVKDCPSDAPEGSKPKVSFDYYEITTEPQKALSYEALKKEMETYLNMNLDAYQEESVKAYQAAFKNASKIYEIADTQQQIDDATSLLEKAKNALQLVIDKTKLAAEIAEGMKLQEDDYTPDSWIEFKKVLESAQGVLKNEQADQILINDTLTSLQKAKTLLEPKHTPVLDKTKLQKALQSALEKEAQGYTKNSVTKMSWEPYKKAYEEADALLQTTEVEQKVIDDTVEKLLQAINQLEKRASSNSLSKLGQITKEVKDLNQSKNEAINTMITSAYQLSANPENASEQAVSDLYKQLQQARSQLLIQQAKAQAQELLASLSSLVKNQYTVDSWKALEEAKTQLDGILQSDKATLDEINTAYQRLFDAKENLKVKELKPDTDKHELNTIIKQAQELIKNPSVYTEKSLKELQNALSQAILISQNNKTNDAEVKTAVTNLRQAIKQLQKQETNAVVDKEQKNDKQTEDKNSSSVDTGDHSHVVLFSFLTCVTGFVVIKGIRKSKKMKKS